MNFIEIVDLPKEFDTYSLKYWTMPTLKGVRGSNARWVQIFDAKLHMNFDKFAYKKKTCPMHMGLSNKDHCSKKIHKIQG
jgi:hypothetical protein